MPPVDRARILAFRLSSHHLIERTDAVQARTDQWLGKELANGRSRGGSSRAGPPVPPLPWPLHVPALRRVDRPEPGGREAAFELVADELVEVGLGGERRWVQEIEAEADRVARTRSETSEVTCSNGRS